MPGIFGLINDAENHYTLCVTQGITLDQLVDDLWAINSWIKHDYEPALIFDVRTLITMKKPIDSVATAIHNLISQYESQVILADRRQDDAESMGLQNDIAVLNELLHQARACTLDIAALRGNRRALLNNVLITALREIHVASKQETAEPPLELSNALRELLGNNVPYLSQSNALGQGFDIYGVLNTSSLLRPVFDLKDSGTKTFTFLGLTYEIPNLVDPIADSKSYYASAKGETRDQLQNTFSAHVKVEASYGAFSGEFQTDYGQEAEQSSDYLYSYNKFYIQLVRLSLNPNLQYLNDAFTQRLEALPDKITDENYYLFEDFFQTFGVYYVSHITLGASLNFYAATSKVSKLSSHDIAAMLTAQYDGLIANGSISPDIKHSSTWKAYTENTTINVYTEGGDPRLALGLEKLLKTDAFNPNHDSVDAFNDWADSATSNPMIVDYGLSGIWELSGDRRKLIQEAWGIYGRKMRPVANIRTISAHEVQKEVTLPTITLGHSLTPNQPPANKTYGGFQVIVLHGDITEESAVKFNRYFTHSDNGEEALDQMWHEMYVELQPYVNQQNILLLVSYEWFAGFHPSADIIGLLRSAGAGASLSEWIDQSHYFDNSVNYILVGTFNEGAHTGAELFVEDPGEVLTDVDVYFHKRTDAPGYSVSIEQS